jgi:hypothetical protein
MRRAGHRGQPTCRGRPLLPAAASGLQSGGLRQGCIGPVRARPARRCGPSGRSARAGAAAESAMARRARFRSSGRPKPLGPAAGRPPRCRGHPVPVSAGRKIQPSGAGGPPANGPPQPARRPMAGSPESQRSRLRRRARRRCTRPAAPAQCEPGAPRPKPSPPARPPHQGRV